MKKYDKGLSMTFIKHTQTGTSCILKPLFLPPANEVCEGCVFTGVCLSTCWDTPAPEQTPPPTRGRPSQVHAGRYGQQAGGTHPTGMHTCCILLHTGSRLQRVKRCKRNCSFKWVLTATELFNIAVNLFDAKKSARYSLVLVVTELVVSGTHCNYCNLPTLCFGSVKQLDRLQGKMPYLHKRSRIFVDFFLH